MDVLSLRFEEKLQSGGSAGEAITKQDLDKMLDEYDGLRGWSKKVIPKEETLLRLEMEGD